MTTEAAPKDKAVATKRKTLPELLNDETHQKNFAAMLGKDARSFAQNILTVYNGSKSLQECEPESIIAACGISASINLSILPSLGQSCIVPYKDGDRLVAQWQIMWKGLIQLAHRSGQYKKIHLAHVYEGELKAYDRHKNLIDLSGKKLSGRVQGYFFTFELITGGTFDFYWSALECVEHGLRYSKSFQKGQGKWAEDPEFVKAGNVKKWIDGKAHFLTEGSGADAMSAKTIVKNELQTWGPLETRIKEIVSNDQAVIGTDGTQRYIDTTAEPAGEAKTYTAPPAAKKGDEPTPEEKIAWARAAAKKQGVSNETFDAWIAAQPGDEAAKATAAENAWKAVARKEITAAQAFALDTSVEKGPAESDAEFKVYSVTESEFNGEPASCIRDTSEPPVKYFAELNGDVAKAATAAKKNDEKLAVKYLEKPSGKSVFRWITKLA